MDSGIVKRIPQCSIRDHGRSQGRPPRKFGPLTGLRGSPLSSLTTPPKIFLSFSFLSLYLSISLIPPIAVTPTCFTIHNHLFDSFLLLSPLTVFSLLPSPVHLQHPTLFAFRCRFPPLYRFLIRTLSQVDHSSPRLFVGHEHPCDQDNSLSSSCRTYLGSLQLAPCALHLPLTPFNRTSKLWNSPCSTSSSMRFERPRNTLDAIQSQRR